MNPPCHHRDRAETVANWLTVLAIATLLSGCATRTPVSVESPPLVPGMTTKSKPVSSSVVVIPAAVIVPSVVVTNYKTLVWTVPGRTGTEACFATWLDEVTATGQIVRAEVVSIRVANPKSPTPQNFTNVVSSTNWFAFWRAGAR